MTIRLTASPTSKISKRPRNEARKKLTASPNRKQHRPPELVERLQPITYNVPLYRLEIDENMLMNDQDYADQEEALSLENPILRAFDLLLQCQFSNDVPFYDKKTLERRKTFPKVVMVNQLYSIFTSNHTYIDREVNRLLKVGILKQLLINHPNFGRSVLMKATDFFESIGDGFPEFVELMVEKPGAAVLSLDDIPSNELSRLVMLGFLNLHAGEYYVSVPNLGPLLKLARLSVNFVYDVLSKHQFKELLESDISNRYDNRENSSKWRKFLGLNLTWALSVCVGFGYCEMFNTCVGRGVKLTGKKLA